MYPCLLLLCFSFLVLSQEISWEEHLRNDRFFLRQVGRKTLTQSIDFIEYMVLWAHVIRPQTASRSVQPFLQGS